MENINIRSIDMNLLSVFEALYEESSVTKAANRLNLTQPTVSGMLKRLREMFGDELFVRTSHGIVPTPRADALAEPVRDLLSDARALLAPKAFYPETDELTVRICGSDYFQHTVISEFADRILTLAPRARIAVMPRPSSGLAEMFARGEMDLAVSISDVAMPDFPSRRLFQDRYVCVSSYHTAAAAGVLSVEALCDFRHAFVDPSGGSFRGPMDAVFQKKGHARRVVLTVPTFATLFAMMRKQELMAFVPERALGGGEQGIARVETELDSQTFEVVANWHPRLHRDPAHTWLRERLYEVAARQG